jgi:myosin-crossreactive antigen
MEAIRSSETSGTTQRTTRRHIPEEDTLQNYRCENLKSYNVFVSVRFWVHFKSSFNFEEYHLLGYNAA